VTHGLARELSIGIEARCESRAQRDSIVGSRGLDKKIVREPGSKDLSIGFGIQRHNSG
jgi:hypothetical protein